MVYNLFLDDIRDPEMAYLYTKDKRFLNHPWEIVRNFSEFKAKVEEMHAKGHTLKLCAFDHDLSPEHYDIPCETFQDFTAEQLGMNETGLDAAKFLTAFLDKHKEPTPTFIVHSMNPVGAEKIRQHLGDWFDTL